MKKLILISIMLLISGCSANYNLKISNDSFKENINIVVPNQIVDNSVDSQIEDDNQLYLLFDEQITSLSTEDKFYKKNIKKMDDYSNVELSYRYDEKTFKESNSINLCFEYPELNFDKNYYINLQGAFYCLYSDKLDIKIQTSNKVYSNNADEIDGNTYIWHINELNRDYVDIEIEIDKGVSKLTYVIIIVTIAFITLLSYIGFKLYKKHKYENEV